MMYLEDKIGISARTITDEGYLIVDAARIARSGIQEYFAGELNLIDRDPFDVIKIYRPEIEVFKKESMDSFSNKPVTNNHPKELVSSKNAKELQVGFSGDNIIKDGIFITTKLTITDQSAIDDIENGKSQLSNGYTSEIEFVAGKTNDGELYDAIQTDIKGNHIAIVDKARCGDRCKITDGAYSHYLTDELNKGKQNMQLIIDGIEFETNDKTLAQAVNNVMAKNKTLKDELEEEKKKSKDELEAEKKKAADEKEEMEKENKSKMDTLQGKVDDAEATKITPKLLDSLVAKRTAVIDIASKVVKDFDATDKDCVAIRTEVVQHKFKDLDLKDCSEEYITARFDAIADDVTAGKSNTMVDGQRQHATNDDGGDEGVADAARNKMIKDSQNAWKNPVGKKQAS